MATILRFGPRPGRRALPPALLPAASPAEGKILLFTGIRYDRKDPGRIEDAPRRKRKG